MGNGRLASQGAKPKKGEDRKSGDKARSEACSVTVKVDKADGASDPQALRTLVERAASAVACSAPGPVKLRITLDKAGKIVKVEVVSGDKKAGEALVRKLRGATSTTRAAGDKATVEVTIAVGN
jgi:hypothetical protein